MKINRRKSSKQREKGQIPLLIIEKNGMGGGNTRPPFRGHLDKNGSAGCCFLCGIRALSYLEQTKVLISVLFSGLIFKVIFIKEDTGITKYK